MQTQASELTPESFGISERGMLPVDDPLTSLPKDFAFYDEFGKDLPNFLATRNVRRYAKDLPMPPRPVYELSYREKILLMVRLSFIVSGYANQDSHFEFTPPKIREGVRSDSVVEIPENISEPFFNLSDELGVPPITSYTFYSANNWERIEKNGPITVRNLRLIQQFLGGADERHFILEHTEIEDELGPPVYSIIPCQQAVSEDRMDEVEKCLLLQAYGLAQAFDTMENMQEFCHPDIYYIRVRPYIFGFNNHVSQTKVVFRHHGRQTVPMLRGETGAQTLSYPALWAGVGIQFPDDRLKQHVVEMRNYLLPNHRNFIEAIEKGPSIRNYVLLCLRQDRKGAHALKRAYNKVITGLHNFFKKLHLKYAKIYIYQKAKKYTVNKNMGGYGTGDTPFMNYLAHHCEVILSHRIP